MYEYQPRRRGQPPMIADAPLMEELIDFLQDEQDRAGVTDAAFAESLGVSRSYWTNVRHRAQGLKPGPAFLAGVKNAYPEWEDRIRLMIRPEMAALA